MEDVLGPLQRSGVGKLDVDQHVSHVLRGNEPPGGGRELGVSQKEQPHVDQEHEPEDAEHPADQQRIMRGRGREAPVEHVEELP